jgi:hypothetical protein
MQTGTTLCPPHHWEVTPVQVDGWPHDHHRCLRCGVEKCRPTGESASIYWDRVATPQTTAAYQERHRARRAAA